MKTNPDGLLLVALLLLAWVGLFNSGVLTAGWRWDDTQILLHAHQYSIWQDFSQPEIWQLFSPANLTPWLIFSFEVDMVLFGLNPAAFYVHQLLAIWAAACMLYLCLTLWCRPLFAFGSALLFLSGLPVMLVAEQLMTRHYIEGLVFCLMALYAFVVHLRTRSTLPLLLALVMYLLAVTAKEIYVPLPAVLLLLPDADWRTRIRAAAPFFVVTALYALWRRYMLSSLSGGYVDSAEYLSPAFVQEVMAAFARFPQLLAGQSAAALVTIMLLLWMVYLAGELRRRRIPWLAAAIALLVLLPLVPLVRSPGIMLADRYLLLPWLMISVAAVWAADRLAGKVSLSAPGAMDALRILPWLAVPVLMVLALAQAVPVRQVVADAAREFDVQGQFLWQYDNQTAFVPSQRVLESFWYVTGMDGLKQRITGQATPQPIVDEIYLSEAGTAVLLSYDTTCYCMRDITAQIPEMLAAHAERVNAEAPLSLRYAYQGGYFSWQFGPWEKGSYHVVSDELGVLPLPVQGQLRVTLMDNAPFYLRYTSPEGWLTYSPLQRVVREAPQVSWSRN